MLESNKQRSKRKKKEALNNKINSLSVKKQDVIHADTTIGLLLFIFIVVLMIL